MTVSIVNADGLGLAFTEKPKSLNAFIGISLSNSFFSKATLSEVIPWAKRYANKLIVVIADAPERYDYIVFQQQPEDEALRKALRHGNKLRRIIRQIDLNLPMPNWSQLLGSPYAQKVLKTLRSNYKKDAEFRDAVHRQISTNMKQRFVTLNDPWVVLPMLANYLLEELAVLIYLFEDAGYPVYLYPADEMELVQDIYSGKYPTLKTELILSGKRGRVHYSL